MTSHTFKETQRFNQIWLWILLIIVAISILKTPISAIFSSAGSPTEIPAEGPNLVLVILQFISVIVIFSIFYFSQLKTIIDDDGIKVKFGWLMKNYRMINWDEVDEVFIRKYNPLDDYGGWGIKHGRKGKALNVKGNKGLQLFLSSKEKLLIGTQKPQELQAFLEQNIFKKFVTVVS